MRVLITGAEGMLGRDVLEELAPIYELYPTVKTQLDITDWDQVYECFGAWIPDVVVHCAAYTDVDGCERDPERAYQVNALGTAHVARMAEYVGARLLYISTDYVFDGKKEEPYNEWDLPNPINIYGSSKLAGEQLALRNCSDCTILRTQWLFGRHGSSFPRAVLERGRAGEKISVVMDRYGCPTYTKDLARLIRRMIERDLNGIFHANNSDSTSWYRFAREILVMAGYDPQLLVPIYAEQWNADARRPRHAPLACTMLEAVGLQKPQDREAALKEFLTELAEEGENRADLRL